MPGNRLTPQRLESEKFQTSYGVSRTNRMSKPFNPLNAELNPICHLLALLGAHHIFHVSVLRVKSDGTKQMKL